MKGKLIPKMALLALLIGFFLQKFIVADKDMTAGQKEKIESPRDFSESADVQPAAPIPVTYSQTGPAPTLDEGQPETPAPAQDVLGSGGAWDFIKANFLELIFALLALLEILVRATKTEKDNSILNFIKSILDAIIPNRRVGGGSH